MKKLIVCPKEKGNTYKVCSYAAAHGAAELKVAGEDAAINFAPYDVVILASGIYGGQAHKNILSLIGSGQMDSLPPEARVYVFFTSFGRGKSDLSAFESIQQALAGRGRKTQEDYKTCYGRGMLFIRASHPNAQEMEDVLEWVKGL